MIEFQDSSSLPGMMTTDALAYVGTVIISSDRVTMNFYVTISGKSIAPDYTPYHEETYQNIPFDPNSEDMPAKQSYNYLMTLPKYQEGIPYP